MSYVLTVWDPPPGVPPPVDEAQADAQLEQQQRVLGPVANARMREFGLALYERFPPTGDDVGPNDAWTDGSEAGETGGAELTFGVNTRGLHFTAACMHAVVQARRLGLNLYDPQAGDHVLADGRRLPPGDDIDEVVADTLWRASDWKAGVAAYREAIAEGDPQALHGLALCLREGLGGPRHITLAGALMQLAACSDEPRRRQRLATLKALPAELREAQAALREKLRAAPQLLPALDAQLAASQAEREMVGRSSWRAPPPPGGWDTLHRLAAEGDVQAALRLSFAYGPYAEAAAAAPGAPDPQASRRYRLSAAAWGDEGAQRRLAEVLLSGRGAEPLNAAEALLWMRRCQAAGGRGLQDVITRLTQRLASGWDAQRDRPRAEHALQEAARLAASSQGGARVAQLRRACELDHPEGWRQLGLAYLRGEDGLPQDAVAGAALMLTGRKELSLSDGELGRARPAELKDVGTFDIDDALRLCRQLIAEPDPWGTLARYRKWLQTAPVLVSSTTREPGTNELRTRVEIVNPRQQPGASAPKQPPAQGLHAGHFTLLTGTVGPLLVLAAAANLGRTGVRLALLLTAACALHGAWRCSRTLGWGTALRGGVALLAALPFVGLFAAAGLLRAAWRRR